MIKRIIQMVVVILLTMPLITQAQMTVTLQGATNQDPGAVSFDIDLSGFTSPGGSMYLQMDYDIELLEYIDYTSTESITINPNYFGVLAINWANASGAVLGDDFLTLNFTYNGGFSNTLTFIEDQCEIADVNGNIFSPVTYVNGSITPTSTTVGTATLGDVDAIAGGEAILPMTITDNGGFDGVAESITLRVGYDTDKLVYSGISANSLGFTAGESDGVITLNYSGTTPLVFPLTDPLLNLNFHYLGGGVAEVNFVSGSIVTDAGGTILSTLFEDGQVDADVPPGSGTLSIERISSEEGEVVLYPPPIGEVITPVAVEVGIVAEGLSAVNIGVLEIVIAYDDDKLDYTGWSALGYNWTAAASPGLLTFTIPNYGGGGISDDVEIITLEFDYYEGLADITFEAGTYMADPYANPIPLGLEDGWIAPPLNVNAKVYLQGAYNGTTTMNTTINSYIPLNQPYGGAPWNYAGTETVTAMPSNVVDWVLVELRTGTSPATATTVVGTRAALLLSDGSIVDTDGASLLAFKDGLLAGDYYIVITHRYHLAIMSATAQAISTTSTLYDFTTSNSQSYGTNALIDLDPGFGPWGLYSGDGNADGEINLNDVFNVYFIETGLENGYFAADWNMDGDVDLNDIFQIYFITTGSESKVPE